MTTDRIPILPIALATLARGLTAFTAQLGRWASAAVQARRNRNAARAKLLARAPSRIGAAEKIFRRRRRSKGRGKRCSEQKLKLLTGCSRLARPTAKWTQK